VSLARVLRFPKRKSLLDLNQDEIDRATVEFIEANKAVEVARRRRKHALDAIAELRVERERLVREGRK